MHRIHAILCQNINCKFIWLCMMCPQFSLITIDRCLDYVYWCLTPLSTIFRYIVRFCFIGGGYWSTKRKSKTSRSPWKILPYICLCRELCVTDANRTPEPYFLTNDSSTEGWIFTLAYAARTYRNDITNQLNYANSYSPCSWYQEKHNGCFLSSKAEKRKNKKLLQTFNFLTKYFFYYFYRCASMFLATS